MKGMTNVLILDIILILTKVYCPSELGNVLKMLSSQGIQDIRDIVLRLQDVGSDDEVYKIYLEMRDELLIDDTSPFLHVEV